MKLEWSKRLAHQFLCISHEHMRQQVQKKRWSLFKHKGPHESQRSNVAETSYVSQGNGIKSPQRLGGFLFFFLNLTKVSNLQSGNPLSLGLSFKKNPKPAASDATIVATSEWQLLCSCTSILKAPWRGNKKIRSDQNCTNMHYHLVIFNSSPWLKSPCYFHR